MTPPAKSYQRKFFEALCQALAPYNLWLREQYPFGPYFTDVYVHPRWIFEIDGPEHSAPDRMLKDEERTRFLESQGRVVIRYTNSQVDRELSDIVAQSVGIIIPRIETPLISVIRCHSCNTRNGKFVVSSLPSSFVVAYPPSASPSP